MCGVVVLERLTRTEGGWKAESDPSRAMVARSLRSRTIDVLVTLGLSRSGFSKQGVELRPAT